MFLHDKILVSRRYYCETSRRAVPVIWGHSNETCCIHLATVNSVCTFSLIGAPLQVEVAYLGKSYEE